MIVRDNTKLKPIQFIIYFLLIFLFLFFLLNSQTEEIGKIADYYYKFSYKFRISGRIYQAIEFEYDRGKSKAVIDSKGNLLSNRTILDRVFYVGRICDFFPEPEQRKERFSNFLEGRERRKGIRERRMPAAEF